jgi:hypothetical protein
MFHLQKLTLNARWGLLHSFEVSFEVRELMKIYRLLKKRNCSPIIYTKIEKILNSLAQCQNYNNFNVNDNISTAKVGVRDD